MKCAALFLSGLLLLSRLASASGSAPGNAAVVAEINLARTHPREYAAIVQDRMQGLPGADSRCVAEAVAFLQRQQPLSPLQPAAALATSAGLQVAAQGPTGAVGHRGPDGASPWSRMSRLGFWTGRAGENISYGYSDARSIVVTLIVDQGVPGRGHRHNIFARDYHVAGAACGPHAQFGAMCVIDFAGGFVEKSDRVAMVDSRPDEGAAAPWVRPLY